MVDAPSQPESSTWRVAVVGGGIAGLAAAHRLIRLADDANRPLDLQLFEAGPRLGGPIETRQVDDFLVEVGPDMFVTDKPWGVELVEELGLADELIATDPTHRRSLVLRGGVPEPVPPGFTLMSTARIWPVLTSRVLSPWGKLRLAWERFVPAARDLDDESLASFVRRRLGREAFDRLVQPLVGGIYTADPEKLSLRATLPRFLDMERDHGSLTRATALKAARSKAASNGAESGARYGLFVTFRDGLGGLVEAVANVVREHAEIRTECAVQSVTKSDNGYSLKVGDEPREFDAVIIATPAHAAAGLVSGVDGSLAAELGSIEFASSAIVCSGYRLDQSEHSLEAFGLVVPHIERRRILAVSMASRKFPGRAPEGHVLLRTFVGGALQPEMLDRSDDEIRAIVREELESIFGIRGEPVFDFVQRYERAMPQYHVGHLQRVTRIDELVCQHSGLALAGSSYRGVGIPDCIHSGRLAAERIFENAPASSRAG